MFKDKKNYHSLNYMKNTEKGVTGNTRRYRNTNETNRQTEKCETK